MGETCTISPASRGPLPLRSGEKLSIWTLAELHDNGIAERSTPRQGGRRNYATVLFCLSSRPKGAKGEESSRARSKGEETSRLGVFLAGEPRVCARAIFLIGRNLLHAICFFVASRNSAGVQRQHHAS